MRMYDIPPLLGVAAAAAVPDTRPEQTMGQRVMGHGSDEMGHQM